MPKSIHIKEDNFEVVTGDIFTGETRLRNGKVIKKYHIGRVDSRGYEVTKGKGKIIQFLLENIGRELTFSDIRNVSGLRLISDPLYTLRGDFKDSEYFELVMDGRSKICYLQQRNASAQEPVSRYPSPLTQITLETAVHQDKC